MHPIGRTENLPLDNGAMRLIIRWFRIAAPIELVVARMVFIWSVQVDTRRDVLRCPEWRANATPGLLFSDTLDSILFDGTYWDMEAQGQGVAGATCDAPTSIDRR
jgi:hypothetical protein